MTPSSILLVEDDPGDRELLRYAFEHSVLEVRLSFARDGEQAVAFLKGEGEFAGRELPHLMLLDLHLPRRSGLEVLEWTRAQPRFKSLPVIILSSSAEPKDIERAYALGANSYVVKNVDLEELTKLICSVAEFAELLASTPARS